jgi:hypothetical protein
LQPSPYATTSDGTPWRTIGTSSLVSDAISRHGTVAAPIALAQPAVRDSTALPATARVAL